jgi:hypothetical protein
MMRCPRCQGCLYTDADSTHCLNCAWYDNKPIPKVEGRKCRLCLLEPAVPYKTLCQGCFDYLATYQQKGKG